jgi:hypothetical protein
MSRVMPQGTVSLNSQRRASTIKAEKSLKTKETFQQEQELELANKRMNEQHAAFDRINTLFQKDDALDIFGKNLDQEWHTMLTTYTIVFRNEEMEKEYANYHCKQYLRRVRAGSIVVSLSMLFYALSMGLKGHKIQMVSCSTHANNRPSHTSSRRSSVPDIIFSTHWCGVSTIRSQLQALVCGVVSNNDVYCCYMPNVCARAHGRDGV